jgi:HEAT repeat protein
MALLLLAALLATQDDPALVAAIAEFDANFAKTKDPAARGELISALAQTKHEKITSRLGNLAANDDKAVRLSAVTALATFADTTPELKRTASKALIPGLTASYNSKEPELKKAILAALGTIQEETSWRAIQGQLEEKDLAVATAAVNAAVALHTKLTVEPLIDCLRDCEKTMRAGANPAIVGRKPTSAKKGENDKPDPEEQKRDRAANLVNVLHPALQGLTGQTTLTTADDFAKWWAKNGKTFNLPK